MTCHFDDSGFTARVRKLARFLPDGKQPELCRLVEDVEQALDALARERADLADQNRLYAAEAVRLRDRVRRLCQQRDRLQGIFRANIQAFTTFRSALTLSRGLRSLAELPEVMVRLGHAMEVPALACLLCREDFGSDGALAHLRPARAALGAALDNLPHRDAPQSLYMGTLTALPEPAFFFGPEPWTAWPHLAGGSCCISPLADKYRPNRILGALVLADPDPSRYAPDKGTDFLEHFCEIFAGDLQHVRIHEVLTRQRESDELTGIPNRAYLTRHGPPLLAMAARKGAPLTMLFCDLDRFKAVNDTFGHAVGDAVLATVARTMADQIRAYDLLARLGGDEFVLLLPDTDPDQAVAMAERIRAAVTEAVAGLGLCGLPGLSVAIGLARYEPGQTIDSLIRQADASMYADKRNIPDT